MANCRTCGIYIGEDGQRKYCDAHREIRGGNYRRKGYIKEYFRKNKRKLSIRITRVTGSGFSEHLLCDRKTGDPLFEKERIAVIKEKKRILRARKINNFRHSEESDDTEKNTVCQYE
jgi:hypothetical protein